MYVVVARLLIYTFRVLLLGAPTSRLRRRAVWLVIFGTLGVDVSSSQPNLDEFERAQRANDRRLRTPSGSQRGQPLGLDQAQAIDARVRKQLVAAVALEAARRQVVHHLAPRRSLVRVEAVGF